MTCSLCWKRRRRLCGPPRWLPWTRPGRSRPTPTKAYFNVTLPEKGWTAQHIAEHMAAFNMGTIVSAPACTRRTPDIMCSSSGTPQFPSTIRKVLGANTNIEGWAHYCEQMMLDEGYGRRRGAATDREAKLIRLGQLQDALLRDARFVVVVSAAHRRWPERWTMGRRKISSSSRATRRGPSPKWKPNGGPRTRPILLHAGQAGDHEAARGLQKKTARRLIWSSSTTILCARDLRRSRLSARRCCITTARCFKV